MFRKHSIVTFLFCKHYKTECSFNVHIQRKNFQNISISFHTSYRNVTVECLDTFEISIFKK